MKRKIYRVVDAIADFYALLDKHPDEPQHYFTFTNFFKGLLREKAIGEALPTIEMVTILKHERPIILFTMKKQNENWLDIITSIDMDVEEAKDRLNAIMNQKSLVR